MSKPPRDGFGFRRLLAGGVAGAFLFCALPAKAQDWADLAQAAPLSTRAHSPTRRIELDEADTAPHTASHATARPREKRGFFERFVAGSADHPGDPPAGKVFFVMTTYAAGVAAFAGATYFFLDARKQAQRAEDFAAEQSADFCRFVAEPECQTYRGYLREETSDTLTALGLGAGGVLSILSGVLLAEYWPNELPDDSLQLSAHASPDSAHLSLELNF